MGCGRSREAYKFKTGDLIFFGRETFDGTRNGCKRQLSHCFISCGTCSKYTHVGIINIENGKIFVYESAIHHHGFDENGDPVQKEGVQKTKLSDYDTRDWYVRKRTVSWNVQLNESIYRKGYDWDLRDWCRARCKCRGWTKRGRGKFCSEYVAAQLKMNDPELKMNDPDLMTPKDLAENPDIPYEDIKGPISKVPPAAYNHMRGSSYKFKF